MTQATPPSMPVEGPPGGGMMQPHRGVMILVFGILGLVLCLIFGIIAWVMGSGDLQKMDAGIMDPTGRGLTMAGKICGMVSVALTVIGIGIWILMVVVIGVGAAASAAGGAGG